MKNNDGQNSRDAGVLSNPLSFLRIGDFRWYGGGLGNRDGFGYYWSLRSTSTSGSSVLEFGTATLNPQRDDIRGFGFAVR